MPSLAGQVLLEYNWYIVSASNASRFPGTVLSGLFGLTVSSTERTHTMASGADSGMVAEMVGVTPQGNVTAVPFAVDPAGIVRLQKGTVSVDQPQSGYLVNCVPYGPK